MLETREGLPPKVEVPLLLDRFYLLAGEAGVVLPFAAPPPGNFFVITSGPESL